MRRDFFPDHLRFHSHHVHDRNSFGDANDELNAGVDCFENSIGRACCGNENNRDVAVRLLSRFPNRVEHRNFAVEHLAALSGRNAGNNVRAVLHALARMKSTDAAGDPLHEESSIFIDEDGHSLGRFPLVHDQFVPIRIAELRHPAHRRLEFFHIELHTALF